MEKVFPPFTRVARCCFVLMGKKNNVSRVSSKLEIDRSLEFSVRGFLNV